MHSTSLLGVLFARLSHLSDVLAPALPGTSSQAATQSEASDADTSRRDLEGRRIKTLPGVMWTRSPRSKPSPPGPMLRSALLAPTYAETGEKQPRRRGAAFTWGGGRPNV